MGGSTLVRAGVLALLLILLSGCGTYSYINVRSSIPGTQGLVKAIVEAHSEGICKDADVEHISADVYAKVDARRPALFYPVSTKIHASDRCVHQR